ncbi:DNA repair protein RecO [Betaproteobacteria bacterium]|nr:DNA repair protein RecO [Betaproteobacteria bacterium]
MHSAFVLHTYPWRESSLIVEFLTENEGRISTIAKGARRRTSSLRGLLIPFNRLLIRYSKKGDLRSLMSAEWDEKGKKQIAGKQLFVGFYINELILKIVQRGESCKLLFLTYEMTLKNLVSFPAMQDVYLRRFEFVILKEIGVMPDFSDYAVTDNSQLYLSPEQGIFCEDDINNPSLNGGNDFFIIEPMLLQVLKTLKSENYGWDEVFQNKKYWLKVKSLLKFLLNGQLNSVELKSRRIMKEITQFSRGINK